MADWNAEQKTIYDDFKDDGFEITIRTPGEPGDFNADTLQYDGATTPSTDTTFALKKKYKASQIDGKIIQQNDTKLLFPAYGLPEIDTSHEILIDGAVQNVINIEAVDPGNVTLFYEAQIRS
ncbi:MAG TPA: hypothetical protein DHV36_15785 [Desulfobacteraceae bacterium]|nr:hypothetical protein [Desulfobacteraceae bacterium]|tara:strand:+ start:351 stop:716 length:366 start_codon:yes stop_codon:yes gene_type:complete